MKCARPLLATALFAALAGCSLLAPQTPEPSVPVPSVVPPNAVIDSETNKPLVRRITPQTAEVKAYRKGAAQVIYKAYANRIYKGQIPPLVHAVVVVETDVDAEGKVVDVFYSRVPSHAPDVPPKIADLIRAASPLPSPGKLGPHTYIETWLWDKSGNFQLDSLTLGQRSR